MAGPAPVQRTHRGGRPPGAEDAEAFLRAVAALAADRVNAWLDGAPTRPAAWDDSGTLSDWSLRLTAQEAAALVSELEAVVERYRMDRPDVPAPPAPNA
ncbi:hypothetical protein ACFQX7_36465 [Luedemannella flava]